MQNHNFTAAGTLPTRFITSGRYSELILGREGETFPTSVKVLKVPQVGDTDGLVLLKEYTAAPGTSVRLETKPNSTIDIEVTTTSGFYVELNDLVE